MLRPFNCVVGIERTFSGTRRISEVHGGRKSSIVLFIWNHQEPTGTA